MYTRTRTHDVQAQTCTTITDTRPHTTSTGVRTRMRTPKQTNKQTNDKAHERTHARAHTHTQRYTQNHIRTHHRHAISGLYCTHDRKRAPTHINTHGLLLLTLLHIHTPHTPQVRDQWVEHMTRRGGGAGVMSPRSGGWGGEGGGSVPPASPRQSLAHSLLSPTTSPRPRTPLGAVGPNVQAKET